VTAFAAALAVLAVDPNLGSDASWQRGGGPPVDLRVVRSSPALNEKLLRSRAFGPLLEYWHRHRGVRPRVKAVSIAMSVTAVAVSAIYGNLPPVGLAVLLALGVTGLVVVIRLPVIRE